MVGGLYAAEFENNLHRVKLLREIEFLQQVNNIHMYIDVIIDDIVLVSDWLKYRVSCKSLIMFLF